MYIKRDFEDLFAQTLRSGKVLVVYGSRQTGKTTIVEKLLSADDLRREGIVKLDGDIKAHRDMLAYETMSPEKARTSEASPGGKIKTLARFFASTEIQPSAR